MAPTLHFSRPHQSSVSLKSVTQIAPVLQLFEFELSVYRIFGPFSSSRSFRELKRRYRSPRREKWRPKVVLATSLSVFRPPPFESSFPSSSNSIQFNAISAYAVAIFSSPRNSTQKGETGEAPPLAHRLEQWREQGKRREAEKSSSFLPFKITGFERRRKERRCACWRSTLPDIRLPSPSSPFLPTVVDRYPRGT